MDFESLYSKDYFYYSYWPFHKFVRFYKIIKLELLTQSIRQQKLPPHPRLFGIRPGCPSGLGSWNERSISCFGYTQTIQLRRLILTIFLRIVNRFLIIYLDKVSLPAQYSTSQRKRPWGGAVNPAFCLSIKRRASPTLSIVLRPVPTSSRVPTMMRTIL